MYEKYPLDMPSLNGLILDDDIKVLGYIIKEHGLTKAMISKLSGIEYEKVLKIINSLQ